MPNPAIDVERIRAVANSVRNKLLGFIVLFLSGSAFSFPLLFNARVAAQIRQRKSEEWRSGAV